MFKPSSISKHFVSTAMLYRYISDINKVRLFDLIKLLVWKNGLNSINLK